MKLTKNFARGVGALAVAGVVVVAAVASAGPPDGKGGGKGKNKPPPPVESPEPDPDPEPDPELDPVDSEFVAMMIPHHHQATLMGQLASTRAGSEEVRLFAERIEVEQGVEIGMMQNWQIWNGLEMTDAETAYEMMLGMPMMMEQMGMASPEEMAALSAASGPAFDRMYLELMITHHEGAVDMLVGVITNGSDLILQQWATDMLNAQTVQIEQMNAMLGDMS